MRSSGIGVSPLRVAQDVRQGRQQPVDLPVGAHTYPQIVACKSGYGRKYRSPRREWFPARVGKDQVDFHWC